MEIRKEVLPVLRPVADNDDIEAIKNTLESGWWGRGPQVEKFEKEFAEMVGAKYAIAVTSASHGQDLVLKAWGLSDVDIISPTISFMTTAIVPIWNRCTSNIVDVRREDLNIDPVDVKKSLKKNTKAIIAVNHAGVPAPIDELRDFFDGFILEDCAHSCYTKGAGSKGDVAVWSFQAVKTMPTGDGGMITTNNREIYEKLLPMIWFGIPSTYSRAKSQNSADSEFRPAYSWDYEVNSIGYKCYMIDLTASIALSQMKKLHLNLSDRRKIQTRYNELLHPAVQRPVWSETVQYYCARVEPKFRNALMDHLARANIHTSVHFKPLHLHPINSQKRNYPIADAEWLKLITLPCHNGMTLDDVDYVIYWVNDFFENQRTNI
jgi:dTDP-4-amino-4,6-dideoxygalactose transaminase